MTESDKKGHSATELFSRVNHLERDTSSIKTEMGGIKDEMGDVKTTLQRIMEMISSGQKAPWGTLISAAGLIVVFIGAILAPFHFRVSNLEAENKRVVEQNLKQADLNGYQRAQLEILMAERDK